MTDTRELRERLRAAAEKATPGKWKRYHSPLRAGMRRVTEVQDSAGKAIIAWPGFDSSHRTQKAHKENAAFIALCSPDNILALLDALATAERRGAERMRERAAAVVDRAPGIFVEGDDTTGLSIARTLKNAAVAIRNLPLDEQAARFKDGAE